MPVRVRIFVDFWNFQLNWNQRQQPKRCDWTALPRILLREAGELLAAGQGGEQPCVLEETVVYASVHPEGDTKLKEWLHNFLGRQPGYRVEVQTRRLRERSVSCSHCHRVVDFCSSCGEPYVAAVEKGMDTAIVTDMLSLAWHGGFDVAVLVTSDSDLVPAVEQVREQGLKVLAATWDGSGHDLARACWGSISLDRVAPSLVRSETDGG
ncbi:MAG: NYN domain-containing protein [Acidimicrobiales bacterium]|nr:MAG: NYN domain-containing protein [Acidimicrobiales bacterium]